MFEAKKHRPEISYRAVSRKVVNRRNWVKYFINQGHTRSVAIGLAKWATNNHNGNN